MSYDYWKTTNPDDEWLGPDPSQRDEPEPCENERPDFEDFFAEHPPVRCDEDPLQTLLEDREENRGEPPF